MNIRICNLGLKHLCTTSQPDCQSVTEVEPPIVGSGEVVEEQHVTVHEVRGHTVMWIHHRDYRFVQVPCDLQVIDTQAAGGNSMCHPTGFS